MVERDDDMEHLVPPVCQDVTDGATDEELLDAWNLVPYEDVDEEGHLWAQPWQLVSGLPENPGVAGHGAGVVNAAVCLRCGTLRTVDTAATDPETGDRIWTLSYDRGLFAEEVAEAAARARVGEVTEAGAARAQGKGDS